MLNKVFIVAEGPLAFGTAVELFCSVHGQVSNQVGGPAETLDTFVTFVGPVTRVNPLVFTKVTVPVKGLLFAFLLLGGGFDHCLLYSVMNLLPE